MGTVLEKEEKETNYLYKVAVTEHGGNYVACDCEARHQSSVQEQLYSPAMLNRSKSLICESGEELFG